MGRDEDIRKGFRRLAGSVGPPPSMLARVKSVNEADGLVILEEALPDGNTIEVFDVRLRPVINGKQSMLLVPKVGTFALAVRIEETEDWMVVGVDEVEKVKFKAGESELVIDQRFELKNSATSLKDILNGLCDALLTVYAPKDITKITETKTLIQTLFK